MILDFYFAYVSKFGFFFILRKKTKKQEKDMKI